MRLRNTHQSCSAYAALFAVVLLLVSSSDANANGNQQGPPTAPPMGRSVYTPPTTILGAQSRAKETSDDDASNTSNEKKNSPSREDTQASDSKKAAHPEGYHKHDGFYFRALIGGALSYIAAQVSGTTVSSDPVAMLMDLSVEYAVDTDIIVSANIGCAVPGPILRAKGSRRKFHDGVGVCIMGPGLSYYFQPTNIFIGASLGLATLSTVNTQQDIANGFGASLAAGKEWWISSNWWLGIAGNLQLATAKDGGMASAYAAVLDDNERF